MITKISQVLLYFWILNTSILFAFSESNSSKKTKTHLSENSSQEDRSVRDNSGKEDPHTISN